MMKTKQTSILCLFLFITSFVSAQIDTNNDIDHYNFIQKVNKRAGTTTIDNNNYSSWIIKPSYSSADTMDLVLAIEDKSKSIMRSYKDNLSGTNTQLLTTDHNGEQVVRMHITQTGNIGLGTTSPKYKLSVDGTIQAKEVKINSYEWADFVFEDEYLLSPLEDVETYIKTNKHLPGIPSAEEVKDNGVGLAEMNVKLLQKIEEQTLYILELHKKIQAIENKLENLQ